MTYRKLAGLGLAALALTSLPLISRAAVVELSAERWDADGQVSFAKQTAYPGGVMTIHGAGATVKGLQFSNGTI